MKWFVQYTNRISAVVETEVLGMRSAGIEPIFFGLVSNGDGTFEVSGITKEDAKEPFIVRCGVKVIQMSETTHEWLKPGISYERKAFDQLHYRKLDLPFYNPVIERLSVADVYCRTFDTPMFIKPSEDLKAFEAGILDAGETANTYIHRKQHQANIDLTKIIVSPVNKPRDERRFVVLDGEVLDGSSYVENFELARTRVHKTDPSWIRAQELADKHRPSRIFVLDLARATEDSEWSIMEYNCYHGAGLYAMDMSYVFKRINDQF